jgi:ATP-dependent DNA ligase
VAPRREYAPGIPAEKRVEKIPSISKPKVWDVAIQRHDAKKRGLHYDLRLVDPATGHAHSWAAQTLPKPGKSSYVVQQPTHTADYALGFQGVLLGGYGAGQVSTHLKEKAEILRSNNDKVTFNVYQGKNSDEYALIRMGKGKIWKLLNRTPTRDTHPEIPNSKPKYRETKPDNIDMENSDQTMMAKIDGAHVSIHLDKGKDIRAYSYRPTERPSGVIEHTRRFQAVENVKPPARLSGTILRGELYAKGKNGRAIDAKDVGAILNSNVLKSRDKQLDKGKLRAAIFDVVKFKGKDVEDEPYDEKLEILREIAAATPGLEIPRIATTPAAKRKLMSDIKSGKEKSTREGVVLWDLKDGNKPPIKAKLKEEHDVVIQRVFGGKKAFKKGEAGGFEFSWTPTGPVVGRVGTGFSRSFRKDMWENPEKYLGLLAKVEAQGKFESGALRAPAFKMLHLDNPGDRLMEVEKVAAVRPEVSAMYFSRRKKDELEKAKENTDYIRQKVRGL